MSKHQLFLNLGDGGWVIARCSCGWLEERQIRVTEDTKSVERQLEEEFERHAGLEPATPGRAAGPSAPGA